jgi:hypothetical protein
MTERTFIASDLESRGLHDGSITALARPIRFKLELLRKVPPDDICPARLSGWVYWNGLGTPDLAEFTKQQYDHGNPCPFGQPGDVLAVKETWRTEDIKPATWWSCAIRIKANNAVHVTEFDEYELWQRYPLGKWQSPVVMPREFVQLRLTVQAVRAVRVQELTEADILALGIVPTWQQNDGRLHTYYDGWADDQARRALAPWWNARWGKRYPYDSNPWLWLATIGKGAE